MSNLKPRFQILKRIPKYVLGIFLLLSLALSLFVFNKLHSSQSVPAIMAKVRFEGEYSIANGPWLPIVEGQHISATKGDVVLRGQFVLYSPDGEYVGVFNDEVPIAIYSNHLSIAVEEDNGETYLMDFENPLYGVSSCGSIWDAHTFSNDVSEQIVIRLHNPHSFGNETAVDEFLDNVAIWGNIDFEREILASGNIQRYLGFVFIIAAFALFGTAVFSTLLKVKKSEIIWLFGLTILSAGVYFMYSSEGVSFWSETVVSNTTLLGISMMFYMLFVSAIIVSYLDNTKKIGYTITAFVGVMDGLFLLLPIVTNILFYDTWLYWVIVQSLANILFIGCLIKELHVDFTRKKISCIGMMLLLIGFEIDVVAIAYGLWDDCYASVYLFVVLFITTLVIVLRIIPRNIHAAALAKELEIEKNMIEAQLKDSRISLMLSQIQPHFIYNTLGTIERLCIKDPEKAAKLVQNFSLYLRGNFSELDSVVPIRFSDEMKHIEYYVNIEKVRFPDMNIEYQLETTNFVVPALSVQPLVENAIKHGLMQLEMGGTVVIHSYETDTHFCVEVKDNGGGFDTTIVLDDKKHVGIRNIRGRLEAMVNGELIIESQLGVGTKAVIMIPKEVTV